MCLRRKQTVHAKRRDVRNDYHKKAAPFSDLNLSLRVVPFSDLSSKDHIFVKVYLLQHFASLALYQFS